MRKVLPLIILFSFVYTSRAQTFSYKKSAEGVEISENKKRVLFLQTKPKSVQGRYERAGYVHPLYDLQGNELTDDMPEDHPYHRGIFWAWHQIVVDGNNVADGWTSDSISFVPGKMQVTKSDKNIILTNQIVWRTTGSSKGAVNIATETARINIFKAKDNYRIIDFNIRIKPLVNNLALGGSDDPKGYGGFCLRIKLPENIRFVSGDQAVEPQETAVMAGPWMDFQINKGGIAVFGHKSTTSSQHPWILRKKTSMQNVPYPGRTPVTVPQEGLDLHYRVVVHNENVTAQEIQSLYEQYQSE